jgi:hypothetical protein
MPVTARLSHKLYETFGDEAGADMVGWMQQIEAQRAELRELNELNFSRFESRLNELSRVVDARFAQFQATMDARFAQSEATTDARFAQFEASIVGRLEAKIEQRTADLMKWSFVFWVGAVAAVAALAGVLR